ncbi:MAG: Ger(x)C family spore germination C-terminal domain-containing protein, partial [Bacillota bacterium]
YVPLSSLAALALQGFLGPEVSKSGWANLEVRSARCSTRVIQEGHLPRFSLEITVNAQVGELPSAADASQREVVTRMEQEAATVIASQVSIALGRCLGQYGSDVFGLGDQVHKHLPSLWHNIKGEWQELLPKIKVDTHVRVRIQRFGTIVKPSARSETGL